MGAAAVSSDLRPKPEPVSATPAPAALMRCRRVNMVSSSLVFFSLGRAFTEYFYAPVAQILNDLSRQPIEGILTHLPTEWRPGGLRSRYRSGKKAMVRLGRERKRGTMGI